MAQRAPDPSGNRGSRILDIVSRTWFNDGMTNTAVQTTLSPTGEFARLVDRLTVSTRVANFEFAWNGYEFYTLKGELLAVAR